MNRLTLATLSLCLLMVFSSCASAGSSETTTNSTGGDPFDNPEQRELPLTMQLAIGTFKLDKTDYPIDADQAGKLLPLWKALRSLSESETTAAAELEAIVKQLQNTMTAEQLDAIEGMQLSFQDMNALAEALDLEFGFGGRFGEIDPEMQATFQAARESGQSPPGGFPGGPPGPGGGGGAPGGGPGGGFSPEAAQTAIAERGGVRGARLGLNPALLEAIIEFLEKKVQ